MWKNLYEETIEDISDFNHTREDISWIGTYDFQVDIDKFFEVAKNTYYDSGFGSAEIPTDLMIVFTNGDSLQRREYDGSEWWCYCPGLKKPAKKYDFTVDNFATIKYETYLIDYVH